MLYPRKKDRPDGHKSGIFDPDPKELPPGVEEFRRRRPVKQPPSHKRLGNILWAMNILLLIVVIGIYLANVRKQTTQKKECYTEVRLPETPLKISMECSVSGYSGSVDKLRIEVKLTNTGPLPYSIGSGPPVFSLRSRFDRSIIQKKQLAKAATKIDAGLNIGYTHVITAEEFASVTQNYFKGNLKKNVKNILLEIHAGRKLGEPANIAINLGEVFRD